MIHPWTDCEKVIAEILKGDLSFQAEPVECFDCGFFDCGGLCEEAL